MARNRGGRYSVSARISRDGEFHEVDKHLDSLGAATSFAQRLAETTELPITVYVRDTLGEVVSRVERAEDGTVYTHGYHSLRAPSSESRRG